MKPTLNPKNPTLKRLAKIAQAKDMPSPTEDQIHRAFVEYVERKHPTLAQLLIHVPNEGKRRFGRGKTPKASRASRRRSRPIFRSAKTY